MFELPNKIVANSEIQSYTVLFKDSHNELTRLEHTLLREIVNEQARPMWEKAELNPLESDRYL
jgi:hypothetical protein